MGIIGFIESLLPNYVAAFLPSSDMIGAAYTAWGFGIYFVIRWCWPRVTQVHRDGITLRKSGLLPPLILIAVCVIGALGGIYWLSSRITISPPVSITSAQQLRERTAALVADLRALNERYQRLKDDKRNASWVKRRVSHASGETIDKKTQAEEFWKENLEIEALDNELKAEFHRRYFTETTQVYDLLCEKLKLKKVQFGVPNSPDTGLNEMERNGIVGALTGQLAGANPISYAADALEKLSKNL
jgi:hypothetical protein